MHARSSSGTPGRRLVAVVAALAVLAGLVSALGGPSAGAQNPPKPEATSPEAALVAAAGPNGKVVEAEGGGPVTFVGTPPGGAVALSSRGQSPRASAQAFVREFGAAFGEDQPTRDLTVERVTPMAAGGKAVHHQQLEGGVPILAGELNVQVTASGKVRSATGELSTGAPVDVAPDVTADTAAATARGAVASEAGVSEELLSTSIPVLWVYDPALLDEDGGRRLVWRIDVGSDQVAVRVEVLVDAHTGDVVLSIDRVMEAKNRGVCDNAGVSGANYNCPAAGVVRTEGGPASGVADVERAYELSGATYDFYKNRFNRDSIDGAGMVLYSTVRACPAGETCPWQNAFWDGAQMVYGAGFASADDVVAHELTHGVTEHESNLTYLNQSGAINESMSDVFGEFVDQTYDSTFDNDAAANRWQMGEDLPASIGVIRNMANPPLFGDPDRMSTFVNTSSDSGGVHTNSGIGNKAAFLITDGNVTFNGVTFGTGLGLTKTARIYYEVNSNLLTSGSNYAALGNQLQQACLNLVGVDGITAGDCTIVTQAVTATEMVSPPPANDQFANATTISGTTGTTTGSTSFATRQTGEPCHGQISQTSCGSFAGTASIWYQFTAAGTGTATVTTCNSGFDTLLAAYTGTAVNALTQVASNDDNGVGACTSSLHSRIQFSVTQGITYRVAVDGYSTGKGAVTLNWTLPAAPTPTGVSGTVTETATGTPLAGAMVAVLNASTFAIAGGGVADAGGNYSAQVPAGSYYLYLIDPAGTHSPGFAGAPDAVTVTNGTMVDKDPTMAPNRGTIAGTITQESPATAISGAYALAVDASTGAPEGLAVANASGQYSLAGLRAGGHWMLHLDPTGAHRSEFYPDALDVSGATTVSLAGGATATVNGALATQTTVGSGATLSGTIRDSVTNAPIEGAAVVALRAADFRLARVTRTNASGQYSLNVVGEGYKLAFIDSAGLHAMEWHANQPGSGLGAATTVTAPAVTDAALDPTTGSLSGTVTDDTTTAAVANGWVIAIGESGRVEGAVTAGNGSYNIAGLPVGTYRVAFMDPSGGRTLEYHLNSPDFAGATPVSVAGGATATVNAALHHP